MMMAAKVDDPARAHPLRRLGHALREAGRLAVGVVYPPTCIACGGATGDPHSLCAACWSRMRFIERPFCDRLGTPFALDFGVALLSPAAIAHPPVYGRARAVARYDEIARNLVHRLKYGDRLELARAMARMMTRAGADLIPMRM
jgi:predicted amidophosphoribosyltransferase